VVFSNELHIPRLDQDRKSFKTAVIRPLHIIGETAGWQLPAGKMVSQAVAAYTFTRTAAITTVTMSEVLFFFALHDTISFIRVESAKPRNFEL
jgi:hypothetical protein